MQAEGQWTRAALEICEVNSVCVDGVGSDLESHGKKVLGEGATGVTQTFCVLHE
jgi:hypothetical protein